MLVRGVEGAQGGIVREIFRDGNFYLDESGRKIIPNDLNSLGRTYIVGDGHGDYNSIVDVLKKVGERKYPDKELLFRILDRITDSSPGSQKKVTIIELYCLADGRLSRPFSPLEIGAGNL